MGFSIALKAARPRLSNWIAIIVRRVRISLRAIQMLPKLDLYNKSLRGLINNFREYPTVAVAPCVIYALLAEIMQDLTSRMPIIPTANRDLEEGRAHVITLETLQGYETPALGRLEAASHTCTRCLLGVQKHPQRR